MTSASMPVAEDRSPLYVIKSTLLKNELPKLRKAVKGATSGGSPALDLLLSAVSAFSYIALAGQELGVKVSQECKKQEYESAAALSGHRDRLRSIEGAMLKIVKSSPLAGAQFNRGFLRKISQAVKAMPT